MLDPIATALDGMRRPVVRRILAVAPVRRLFVARERRIAAAALVAVPLAVVPALLCPLVALWLGAALLGVPHVVSGLRHTVGRRRVSTLTIACGALALLVGIAEVVAAAAGSASPSLPARAASGLASLPSVASLAPANSAGWTSWASSTAWTSWASSTVMAWWSSPSARASWSPLVAWAGNGGADRAFALLFGLATVGEVWRSPRSAPARVAAAAALVAATAAAVRWPSSFVLALAHLHAAGSVAWFALRARRQGVAVLPFLVAVALVVIAIASGAADPLLPARLVGPRSAIGSIAVEAAGSWAAHPSAIALRRALALYAFGQSLHFAVWLRLAPELDRRSPVPHGFRRALALLRADLGRLAAPAVVVSVAAAPLLLVFGGPARELYFALTYFHFGVEAAAVARAASDSCFALFRRREAPPSSLGQGARRERAGSTRRTSNAASSDEGAAAVGAKRARPESEPTP